MRKDPILLTGVYRSGTTILSCMLDAHPEINFTYGSVNYLRWFVKKNVSPVNYKDIVLETQSRLQKRFGKVIDYEKIVNLIESSKEDISHRLIYSSIMQGFFDFSEKMLGERILLEWTNVPAFLEMYPDGKVLHIIRDPRDVLASYKGMTWESGYRYLDAIFACMDSMDHCIQYKKTLPKRKYYAVSYESLVRNPEHELKNICAMLGVEYSEKMMDKSRYKDERGERFNLNSHSSYSDNKKKRSGRWKDQLSGSDLAFLEALLHKQLSDFNYADLSGNGKPINDFLSTIAKEDLLKSRLLHYLETGRGCEEFPSDSTKEENWTVLGEKNKNASSLYIRNKQ
jgi:hypothetical protein